ncbi:MAG TPA: MFS transporter [Burkholderiaceae bacterium]|nr:MFS transporter [Burkholderiaceae bacterium]
MKDAPAEGVISTPASRAASSTFSAYQKFVTGALAFLQFTLVLDFMMLSPLGALVMPALRISPSQFGLVVSTYAFSAGVSGILTAGFADRFDRKRLLLFFYAGFLVGTLLCGIAGGYGFLLFARMVTGLFAGVVGSVSLAIVSDLFPLQMRGRVMGIIQTSFSASSVLGIPLSLWLSNRWGWNAPFLMIAGVGAAVGVVVYAYLRPVADHLQLRPDRSPRHHLMQVLSTRRYLVGFATTGLISIGGFMLMPFVSVFNVQNVGIPLERLPLLFLVTGACSMVSGPLVGRTADKVGAFRVFAFGCAATILMVTIYTHLGRTSLAGVAAVMVLLQIGIFSRLIAASALTSALPLPADRGAYMSISAALQQVSGGIAAVIAGLVVVQTEGGPLLHFDTLGYVLVATTIVSLSLMYFVDRAVARPHPVTQS